jgi:pimeloyl-ACP methyl ester carboxylesterase
MPESKRFNTGEVDLSYTEFPGESPAIVAIHGISATRSLLFVEQRGDLRAYAYDHRGHGESGRAARYRFSDYGDDAIAFLRGVVREPALLIGHSLGAMTAMYAAANAPETVRAVFLADPPLYAPEQPLRDEALPFAAVRDQAGKPVAELLETGMAPVRAEMVSRLDPGVMSAVLDGSAFAGWDTDDLLSRMQCPAALQHGDRVVEGLLGMGSAIYPGELDRARAAMRNGSVLHIPGTGHAAWVTKPDEWAEALRGFIRENS